MCISKLLKKKATFECTPVECTLDGEYIFRCIRLNALQLNALDPDTVMHPYEISHCMYSGP